MLPPPWRSLASCTSTISKKPLGQDLDTLPAGVWVDIGNRIDVFVRTTPEHKLRLVEALEAKGHGVVMTGDGVAGYGGDFLRSSGQHAILTDKFSAFGSVRDHDFL